MKSYILLPLALLAIVEAQKDPHYKDDRKTMVHLFEWKFSDIADECEQFLGPMGYGGVQTSPIHENLVVTGRPWWERYQPISTKIISRSGTEEQFRDMVRRCNAVDVRTYVDVVFNHMTGDQVPATGTGGSVADTNQRSYPAVPYGQGDFHRTCEINNYQNATEVRDCQLSGLHDLDQSKESVRGPTVAFLNRIIDAGAAGIRVDAAKHMWPEDLKVIYSRLNKLNTGHGFVANSQPYIYQEVIDLGGEAVSKFEYNDFAGVIEFQYGIILGNMFRGLDNLTRLETFNDPNAWSLLPSGDALVMIDNHDNQRGHGAGGASILTYKHPKLYKMAVAFMLAHPYGHPRVMSSFAFDNTDRGPPMDGNENILSPVKNGACTEGWVCEHRWPQIVGMNIFRNVAKEAPIQNWWSNGRNQIAFSRGSNGFIVLNVENADLNEELKTGLPAGNYCDVISGKADGGKCTGKTITVGNNGEAQFSIPRNAEEGVIAIHIGATSKL